MHANRAPSEAYQEPSELVLITHKNSQGIVDVDCANFYAKLSIRNKSDLPPSYTFKWETELSKVEVLEFMQTQVTAAGVEAFSWQTTEPLERCVRYSNNPTPGGDMPLEHGFDTGQVPADYMRYFSIMYAGNTTLTWMEAQDNFAKDVLQLSSDSNLRLDDPWTQRIMALSIPTEHSKHILELTEAVQASFVEHTTL